MGKGKMVICTILLLCTVCFFSGCQERTGTPEESPYYAFQGVRIGTAFGDAQDVFGAYENRIAEDAHLVQYLYAHFFVITAQKGDREEITTIVLRSNAVGTEEGVSIGDGREKVIETYGADFTEEQGQMTYVKQDTALTFLVDEEGIVLSITYSRIAEE